ncbi:PAS domain-containing serine/threonine-protein like [Argiope bruennichi]|uniref:PAS domain-containing serine/threonine-protein like n=1 Tax=Argiope bruennichi TaxID=94029 RepID=A0A8T0E6Y3_ARGBR|nr:PAS domain-containing serine/threonine-protein like [Argiope bruennichi]
MSIICHIHEGGSADEPNLIFVSLQLCDFEADKTTPVKKIKSHYLSPYEASTFHRNLASEFHLTPGPKDSFLHNQSFPNAQKDPENGNASFDMGESHKFSISRFKGDSLDSFSYSPLKTSPLRGSETHNIRHLNGNSPFCDIVEAKSANISFHMQNPTKAVVTIDAETTEILTANKLANKLLGLRDEHDPVKLIDFIKSPEDQSSFFEADLKPNGELVLFAGKVMDVITASDHVVPVSVWARGITSDSDYRYLVVMEPVERTTGIVHFDHNGRIFYCDQRFVSVFGYSAIHEVLGLHIVDLMPNVEFNSENKSPEISNKQCVTGRTQDGFIFPLSIQIGPIFTKETVNPETDAYEGIVWVFSNISGLITLSPDGTIHSCNTNFSLLFFGYSQTELVGKNISFLIPSFYDDYEYLDTDSMALPMFDEDDDSNAKYGTSDGRTTADSIGLDIPSRPMNPVALSPNMREDYDDYNRSSALSAFGDDQSVSSSQLSFNQQSPEEKSNEQLGCIYLDSSAVSPHSLEKPIENSNSFNDELSASSSRRSRHLSYSESQDTLHSGTNSITGSDINANFYGPSDGKVSFETHNDTFSEHSYSSSEASSSEHESASESEADESSEEEKDNESLFSKEDYSNKKYLVPSIVDFSESNSSNYKGHVRSRSLSESGLKSASLITKISTPKEGSFKPTSENSTHSILEGDFIGLGRHRDGFNIGIQYIIKKVTLDDGKALYCLWVSRDPEIKEIGHGSRLLHDSSRTESADTSHSDTSHTESQVERSSSATSSEASVLSESVYIEGDFSKNYTIMQHLRKGAFGCIKRAYRNSDGLLVIAKFIKKSEVYKDSWIYDNKFKKEVPIEIAITNSIDHPNIVKVLEVFENDTFFQMVMEKHGHGMDLFEFIEKHPKMDEPLGSYIFRQIVAALSHLHVQKSFGVISIVVQNLKCLHRVLTPLTLLTEENPFVGPDEILEGVYAIPSGFSEEVIALINHLLEPDPLLRCTLPEVEENPWVNQPVCIDKYKFDEVINCSYEVMHPAKYYQDLLPENNENTDSESSCLSSKLSHIKLSEHYRSSTDSEVNFQSSAFKQKL